MNEFIESIWFTGIIIVVLIMIIGAILGIVFLIEEIGEPTIQEDETFTFYQAGTKRSCQILEGVDNALRLYCLEPEKLE
jgi:hypothetical protein